MFTYLISPATAHKFISVVGLSIFKNVITVYNEISENPIFAGVRRSHLSLGSFAEKFRCSTGRPLHLQMVRYIYNPNANSEHSQEIQTGKTVTHEMLHLKNTDEIPHNHFEFPNTSKINPADLDCFLSDFGFYANDRIVNAHDEAPFVLSIKEDIVNKYKQFMNYGNDTANYIYSNNPFYISSNVTLPEHANSCPKWFNSPFDTSPGLTFRNCSSMPTPRIAAQSSPTQPRHLPELNTVVFCLAGLIIISVVGLKLYELCERDKKKNLQNQSPLKSAREVEQASAVSVAKNLAPGYSM